MTKFIAWSCADENTALMMLLADDVPDAVAAPDSVAAPDAFAAPDVVIALTMPLLRWC